MLGINCLLNNLEIIPNLKKIVEYTGYNLAANNKRPTIEAVYNNLRKAKLEVDIQTVSHLYEEVFDLNDETFSSADEVNEARGQTFRRIANKREALVRQNQIGKDSPVVAAAAQLANMINGDLSSAPTIQKIMQDRLVKASKRIMQLEGKTLQGKTTEEILREVLSLENKNPYYVLGAMENAETLFKELQSEFSDLASIAGDHFQEQEIIEYAEVLEESAYGLLLSTPEMQMIIRDTLKEAGFAKEIKTKDGVRTVVDWKKVTTADIDFRETIKNVFSKKGFSAKEVNRIATDLEGEFSELQQAKISQALFTANKKAANNVKDYRQQSEMNKLLELYQLGIFNSSSQQALMKVLGVTEASQKQIAVIQTLMKQYNAAIKQPMSKWSPTYIKTLQREIENIIEQIEEHDARLKALRIWGFVSQLNGTAILANLQNITENTTSGLVEYMITLARNPKQAIESAKVFWNVFTDIIGGGVREGTELSNAFNTSGNFEDRFNFETAKTPKQKMVAAVSTISRTLLSSFDNAYKASISHLLTINTMRKVLNQQGLSNHDSATVVNEIYFGNRTQIEDMSKMLAENLVGAGVKNVGDKWKRIAGEISMANLLSDGQFFNDTINRLEKSGAIQTGNKIELNEKLIKAIRVSAEATASKGLGHEADAWALQLMDKINAGLNEKITEARKNNDKDALIRAEIGRNAYGMINRFRSGALRWMWLSFQKASGIALIQTLITDVALNKGKYLNFDNLRLTSENENEIVEDLSKYLALRQRLVRETLVPFLSYTVGYGAILPMLLALRGEDDDEEGYGALAAWIESDPARKRWFQKGLPLAVFNYLDKQTKNVYGVVSVREDVKKPSWSDVIDPEIAVNALVNTFNQATVARLAEDTKRELNKTEGNYLVPAGKFVGNFLNLGGLLKNYQLNADAIKVIQGKATKLSKKEYDEIKPDNFIDGFLYNSLDQQNYKRVRIGGEAEQKEIKQY